MPVHIFYKAESNVCWYLGTMWVFENKVFWYFVQARNEACSARGTHLKHGWNNRNVWSVIPVWACSR